ncbi:MAG: polysialyltransferase family glycosyltransferase [Gallionellaceae bacterium]
MLIVACQTPLHFLLASIILNFNNEKAYFIWLDEADIDEEFVLNLVDHNNSSLVKLPGSNRQKSKLSRFRQQHDNIKYIKKNLALKTCTSLLIFNDLTPETQFLIHIAKSNNAKISLGEDGVAIYGLGGIISVSLTKKVIGKLIYGWWWRPFEKIGINPLVSNVYAARPSNVRSDVSHNKKISYLPIIDTLAQENATKVIKIELSEYIESIFCIIPLSITVGKSKIASFVNSLEKLNMKIVLKFHPREPAENINEIIGNINLVDKLIASKNLPAELYCLGVNTPTLVVGYRSSALHIIASLNPSVNIAYYEPSDDVDGAKWKNFYQALGVKRF